MDLADRPRTVSEAFASAVEGFISGVREVRAEAHATDAAAADAERRLNNLMRLEAMLRSPAPFHRDAAE